MSNGTTRRGFPRGTSPPDTLASAQLFAARMKAHDVVQEHLKQVITISSAVLALTITFLKDTVGVGGSLVELSWLLPVSWVFLGFAIFVGVYSIAVLVNNLDFPAKKKSASFAAGAKRGTQVPAFLTFLAFGVGMLSLGMFAARNYDHFLRRASVDYKIASALQAVDEAERQLQPPAQIAHLSKVELLKGADDSAGLQVWHVQLEIKRQDHHPTGESRSSPLSSRSAVRHGHRRRIVVKEEAPDTESFNCLIEAKSGRLIQIH